MAEQEAKKYTRDVKPRLRIKYEDSVKADMQKEFEYKNVMQIPKVTKVTLNMGLGRAVAEPKVLESAVEELAALTGRSPVVTVAKKDIATFKLRKGHKIGCMVTLRGATMWEFLDRLINVALPRVRDFRGVSAKAFDGRGNYTLGVKEQIIFPEIDYDKIDQVKGINISIVTTANSDSEARSLLKYMGMPFRGQAPVQEAQN